MFYCAAHHALESITAEALTLWAERVDPRILGCEVYVLPLSNPDGVEIVRGNVPETLRASLTPLLRGGRFGELWQANARGVDLNHNYNANWESGREFLSGKGFCSPSFTRFCGPSPESEPESRAIADFIRKTEISLLLSLHSQGEVIYYDSCGYVPPRGYEIALALSLASGYRLEQPEKAAQGGGLKDWFIDAFDRPAYTLELGTGKNPLPHSMSESVLLSAAGALNLAARLA